MKAARWNRSALIVCLIAGGLAGNAAGTASAQAALPPTSEPGQAAEPCCDGKDHVHIFMINGLTILPHIYGSMNPVGDTLSKHGFVHNQTATHYYRWSFQDKIRCVHQCDPQARIVLVGYSIGAGVVQSMANTLDKEGIPVALLVYLDGHSFVHNFHDRPANAERIVCITSTSLILKGIAVPVADCLIEVGNTRHLTVPKNDETLQILLRELNAVAATVPPAPVTPTIPASSPPAPVAPTLPASSPPAPIARVMLPAIVRAQSDAAPAQVAQVTYETTPSRYAPPCSRPPICDCCQSANRPVLRRLWQSSRGMSPP